MGVQKKRSYTQKNVKENKSDKFYIIAKDSKGHQICKSKKIKVEANDQTAAYFSRYKNILVSNKKASQKQIDEYCLRKEMMSSIKYNYSKKNKTLYIHLYLNVHDNTNNKKIVLYDKDKKIKKIYNKKYKDALFDGIIKNWSLNYIRGNSYDFEPGVKFKTKVVIHESNSNYLQNYVDVYLGSTKKLAKYKGNYWFLVRGIHKGNTYYGSGNCSVFIPTQELLNSNKAEYGPEASLVNFERVIAHEMGHVMGLNDGYKEGKTKRSIVSTEIGHVHGNVAYHIMNNSIRNYSDVFPNDIEMIIKAQEEWMNQYDISYQSYKDYKGKDKVKYKKSKMIRMRGIGE